MSMHSTGRFPRTVREAFPQDRFPAIEVFRGSPERFVVGPAMALAIVLLVAIAVAELVL
jgi:hypothetical protein